MAIREVIFRGKRADNGEWIEGDLLQIKYYNKPIIECKIMPQTPVSSAVPVLPETVGQYTGLTDKNGKKIFEGDIIEFHEEIGKIKYSDYDAAFDIIFDTWNTNFSVTDERRIEVIGNIHDNPELLE